MSLIYDDLAQVMSRPGFHDRLAARQALDATSAPKARAIDLRHVRSANPFAKKHRNLTIQAALMRENPSLAAELRAEAAKIDGGFYD